MARKPKGIEATGLVSNGLPQLNYDNKIIINRIIHAKITVSAIVNLNLVNANSVPILSFFFSFPFFLFFSFLSFGQLVLKYRTDESIRDLVDKLEWIVIPVVNVDGYVYTHSTVRRCRLV